LDLTYIVINFTLYKKNIIMENGEINIEKLESVAIRFRSLAHPIRITIIEMLKEKEEMNVTAIYKILDIAQPAASHHLNMLKNMGILASRRAGKKTYYSLKQISLDRILKCVDKCNDF